MTTIKDQQFQETRLNIIIIWVLSWSIKLNVLFVVTGLGNDVERQISIVRKIPLWLDWIWKKFVLQSAVPGAKIIHTAIKIIKTVESTKTGKLKSKCHAQSKAKDEKLAFRKILKNGQQEGLLNVRWKVIPMSGTSDGKGSKLTQVVTKCRGEHSAKMAATCHVAT